MIIQGITLKNTTVYDASFNSKDALLYVDAGNSASYPGSGLTWTDLSSTASSINTVAKQQGTAVWGTDTRFIYVASGGAPTDIWYSSSPLSDITPI